MRSSNLLFVYGTLMSGFDGHFAQYLRKNASLLGEATCQGYLYKISYYPGLVIPEESPPEAVVYGELYELSGTADGNFWAVLDEYEGVPTETLVGDEYVRREIAVSMGGKALSAWAYVYTGPVEGPPLATGRFLSNQHST
jgi:gamma-glutamylcyclotransferase (GGCT)/AIG2-like uncharacterized protein YtfP